MTLPVWVRAVVDRWRAIAAQRIRFWAGDPIAAVLLHLADELEADARAFADAEITIREAAEESGYSAAHLRDLAHKGLLRLSDRDGVMRVRRGDLPKRPRQRTSSIPLSPATQDLAQAVRAARGGA